MAIILNSLSKYFLHEMERQRYSEILEFRVSSQPNFSPASSSAPKPQTTAEPIVIDDEEDPDKDASLASPAHPGGSSASHSPGALSNTEADSELRIASVTTLGGTQKESFSASALDALPHEDDEQADMNLMITSVTSLQGGGAADAVNGLQISNAFSLNPDSSPGCPTASFNPGRGSGPVGQLAQNGDMGSHNRADSWISQSASVPRSLKQTGVDSPSPATSLPKPPGQSSSSNSSSGSQPQPRTVKVTCANCKKPLKKGQTAYQRKGSTHLFCSTTCLSAFSHKPAPKKSCTMCKKDITNMKGTIVAQVDSSESFQEFCSTGCLGAYENKQNPPKSSLKTKCTVCGKLTEIRHEVSFKTVTHKICSDTCFNVYRRANGLIMNCCEQCGDYLPSRPSANHFLLVDGQQKRFCCQNCIRDFKQAHSKLATCQTCKTLIKTGEVLHGLGVGGVMGSFCSVNCLNKGKLTTASFVATEPTCHFCKRNSLPQYQATLPEGNVLNFCSSQCVTKFQNATLQTATNGQLPLSTAADTVQLKCNYCRGAFSLKPETLEWEDKMYQFCSKVCCEDYKKLHCIVTFCEYCQEERTLHETVKFSGVKRPFCSEGCKLLFKQDFIKRLGLKCVSCNHCNQLCKKSITRQFGGTTRDFCSETCAKKFHDWFYKAARCDCCKVQGNLTESVMWRAEMKQFCDQDCLLKFYCQQNEPIMVTQKGPENSSIGTNCLVNQGSMAYAGGLMRDVKNKAVLCKPLTLTKATYCKPHMQSKHLQTDDGIKREYVPVPIPVPVFIPMPMNMYSQVTPTPVSLPIPVPVPVFLPTTLQGAEQIIESINELKNNVTPELQRILLVFYFLWFLRCHNLMETSETTKSGNKRQAVEQSSAQISSEGPSVKRSLPLKARYGIYAWKRWVLSSEKTEDTKDEDGSKPGNLPSQLKTYLNLLSLSPEELNEGLSQFVREVCRPNGERYSPDSIFYLCLGIQQHLHTKGRKDDLFSDSCYQQFGEELNKVLKDWQPSVLPDGLLWSRVEEQSLWSSRQLGEQSPAMLLRSLVYLNTKYFGLRTVEQHLRLSFANLFRSCHKSTKCVSRVTSFVPSVQTESRKRKRKSEDDDEDQEPSDSAGSTVRCPVKKHECHLYDLPPSLRDRLDLFYVQPDPARDPDGQLWFTSTPLESQTLENLLTQVLLVRDVYTDKHYTEEDVDGGE
uniref:Zinc finger MYM-type containing 2 n=1 Tax=Takifugu rubripes TaxID=31033 RepID=A0A674NWL8_TAKRU